MLPSGCTIQHNIPGNTARFYMDVSRRTLAIHTEAIQEAAIWSHLCCLFARNAAVSHYGATRTAHVPPSLPISLAGPEMGWVTNWHICSCPRALGSAGWAVTPGRRVGCSNSLIVRALLLGTTEPSVMAISFTVPCLQAGTIALPLLCPWRMLSRGFPRGQPAWLLWCVP